MADNTNKKKLYDVVVSKGLYTKSYDDFNSQYSTPEAKTKLYNVLMDQGLYSKSASDFENKYFSEIPSVEKKNPNPTPQVGKGASALPSTLAGGKSSSVLPQPKSVSVTPGQSQGALLMAQPKPKTAEDFIQIEKQKRDVTSPNFYGAPVEKPQQPKIKAPEKVGALEDISNTFMSSLNRFASGVAGLPNMAQKAALMMTTKMLGIDDEYNALPVAAKKEIDGVMSNIAQRGIPSANVSRDVQDYFIKKSDEFLENTNKSEKYLNERFGDFFKAPTIEKATDLFLEIPKGFAGSLPYMINPLVGAVSAASEQYNKDIQEADGKLGWGQLANAGVTGVSEFYIEKISNGILNRSIKDAIGAPKAAKDLAEGFVKSVLKDVGMEFGGEGLTQLAQSLSNDITKGQEIDWVKTANEVLDAAITGAGIAGGMRTTGAGVGYLANKVMPKSDKDIVDRNTRAIMDLNNKKGPDNSPEVNAVIDSKIQELNKANIDIINSSVDKVKSLSDDQIKEVVSVDSKIADIYKQRDAVKENQNLSDEEKKSLLDYLRSQASTLNKQKDAIQKQTTSEVPVQPEAGTGLQVAEGESQAEPQVPTQEGQGQEVTPTAQQVAEQQLLEQITNQEGIKPRENRPDVENIEGIVKDLTENISKAKYTEEENKRLDEIEKAIAEDEYVKDSKNISGVKYSDIFIGNQSLTDILDKSKLSIDEKNQIKEIFKRNIGYFKFNKSDEQKFLEGVSNPEDAQDVYDALSMLPVVEQSNFNAHNQKNYENVKTQIDYIVSNPDKYSKGVVDVVSKIKEKLDNPRSSMDRLYAIDVMSGLGVDLKTQEEGLSEEELNKLYDEESKINKAASARGKVQAAETQQPTAEQPTTEQPVAEEPKPIKAADAETIAKEMQNTFGLNKTQSKAAAVVIDKIAGTMAKRAGTTKSKIMDAIVFQKGDINELSDRALFQKAERINGNKEDLDKAVDEIRSLGYKSPFGNGTFMPNGTEVEISNFDGGLWISSIFTPNDLRGKGLATETMVEILNIASKYNVPVRLEASPFGSQKDLTKKQLIDWYKKLGFKDIGYGELQKAPSAVKEEVANEGKNIQIEPVVRPKTTEKPKMPEGAKLVKPENFMFDGEYDVVVNGKTIGNIYYDRASKTWNDPNFDRSLETPWSFKWIYGEILGETKEEAVAELINRKKQFPGGVKPKGDVLFQKEGKQIPININEFRDTKSVGRLGFETGGTKYVSVDVLDNLQDVTGANRGGNRTYQTESARERIDEIKKSLLEDGWIEAPIYVGVDADGYAFISEGNHRLIAAKELGMKEIPVKVQFDLADSGVSRYNNPDIVKNPTQIISKEEIDKLKEIAKDRDYHIKNASIYLTDLGKGNTSESNALMQGAKGAMQLANDGSAIIYALTDPDVSTPLHEMAHVYENYLTDAERKTVLDWAGKKDWDMPVSEKFARGFEKYLAEGKSPNKELTKIFESFKKWLLDIYNGIIGSEIDIKLNDDMRKLYDTMLSEGEEVGIKELPGYDRMMGEVDGIIEKSFKRGVPFNQAMDNVMQYMSKSKVYEDATDTQREEMVREVRKMFSKKEKKAPTAQKILGQKPTKTTVVVDEAKEIKKRLKALETAEETGRKKGYKKGTTESDKVKKEVIDYVKSLKVNNKISGSQFKAINNALKGNLRNPAIRKRVEDRITNIINRANAADLLERAKSIRKSIKTASKSKTLAPNISRMAKNFARINPSSVPNVEEYMDMANVVYDSIGKPIRNIASVDMVNAYTDARLKEAQDAKNNALMEQYNALVEAGVLSEGMSLKDIQDYILSVEQNKLEEVKEEKEKEIRDRLNEVFDSLSDIASTMIDEGVNPFTGDEVEISAKDKAMLKEFINMDLNKLPIASAYRAQEALMNYIVNGKKFGMQAILAKYQGQENVKIANDKGLKAGDFRWGVGNSWWGSRKWAKEVESIPGLFTWIFRGRTRGLEMMKLMGLDEFMSGSAKAKLKRIEAENEYISKFLNKKPNGKRFNDISNTYQRLVYGYLSRTVDGTAEEKQTEFERRKRILGQVVQALEQSRNKDLIEEGKVLSKEFDKVKDANTLADIQGKFDKTNEDAVKFVSNMFDKDYEFIEDVAEGVYNLILSKDELYTPDMFRSIVDEPINVEDATKTVDLPFDLLNKKPAGTMMENKRIQNLPGYDVKNKDASNVTKILRLDFDASAFNAYEKALIDAYTAESVQKYSAFVNSKDFNKLFDNSKDETLFKEIVNYYINNERGKIGYKSDWKAVQNFSNRLKTFSTYRALGSISAIVKQSLSAMVNTSINLSNDPNALKEASKAMLFNSPAQEFINRSGSEINLRGAESTADIKSAERLIRNSKYQTLNDVLDVIDKAGRLQMKSLTYGDVPMARASWIGYYVHALKMQGKPHKNIDWSTAKLDKDAMAYANNEISINQNASMPSTMGRAFATKNPGTRLLMAYMMPFTSFLFNAKSRLKTDFTVLTSKLSTAEDKQAAGRSMAATFAELPAYIIMQTAVNYGLVAMANAFLGYNEDEEDEKLRMKRYSELALTRIITDLISPVPNVGDVATVAAFNALLEKMQEEPDMTQEEKMDLFKLYESKPESVAGALAEMFAQPIASTSRRIADVYTTLDMAIGDYYITQSGKEIEFSAEDKKMLKIAAAMQVLGNLNLLPSEAESLAKKMVKTIEKRAKEEAM